jgi:hypothetical protein
MSSARQKLLDARDRRDAARDAFDDQYHHLRGDAGAETIGQRLVGRLGQDARSGMRDALDVASESKMVIAGTVAALTLWILRGPILAWLGEQWHRHITGDDRIYESDHPADQRDCDDDIDNDLDDRKPSNAK